MRFITIGPGDAFWSAFGHSAIAIDDVVYGFGYFSFDDDIIQSFISNQMQYDLGISDLNQEALLAEQQNRTFSVIELNLTVLQARVMEDYLKWHYKPENQTYTYDYFLNNCSTKIRDLLDFTWSGELESSNNQLTSSNYFKQTFPAKNQGLMNIGLAMAYGGPAYTARSHWELMALPVYFENQIIKFDPSLVMPRQLIYSAHADSPFIGFLKTHWTLITYFLIWTWVLLLPMTQQLAAKIWFVMHGLIGVLLLGFWLLTPHQMIDWNFNVLLFNPLGLLFLRHGTIPLLILLGWVLWLLLALYLQAWYLIPLLIPALLAYKYKKIA